MAVITPSCQAPHISKNKKRGGCLGRGVWVLVRNAVFMKGEDRALTLASEIPEGWTHILASKEPGENRVIVKAAR